MGNIFLSNKKLIGMKLEDTPYTGETLTSTDFVQRCSEVKYTPAIAETVRRYATGDFGAHASIMGKQTIDVAFTMDMAWSGATSVAPEWALPLKACSFGESGTSTKIYTLNSTSTSAPITIWILETNTDSTKQLAIKATGCMGDVKFSLGKIGDPLKMQFSFKGVFAGLADLTTSSLISHGTFTTTTPDAVLASTITAFTEVLDTEKVDISVGNKVEMVVDPSNSAGVKGCVVADRDPKIALDPLLDTLASRAIYTRWLANTTGAFSMTVGSHLTISVPKIQITKGYDGSDRNGQTVNSLDCKITRASDSSDADIVITQA
jgi:hypothetical protein